MATIARTDNATNAHLVNMVVDAARVAIARWKAWDPELSEPDAAIMAHDFCRTCIRYEAETADQTIRLPSALLREGVGDCKSTAVFIAAMCAAAGRKVALRFFPDETGDQYTHVVAVVDGRAVDPLLEFGTEMLSLAPLTVQLT